MSQTSQSARTAQAEKAETFLYSGPQLSFICKARKEHNLFPGQTYKASALPEHPLIENAKLRGTLTPVEKPDAAAAKQEKNK
jgi:hypothetical protein